MNRRRRSLLVPLMFFFSLLSLCGPGPVTADPAQGSGAARGALHVQILGLRSSRGDVIFALYNSRKTFTRKAYHTAFVPITDRRCEWEIKDLPAGDYAVVVVHDRNGNHDMDRNFLGIPREPYAFSNNARALFGAPSFQAAKFRVVVGRVTNTQIDLD